VEVYRVPHGTNTAGSKRIISALRSLFASALRSLFAIFGVPEEMKNDGGPEFAAEKTLTFLRK